MGEGYFTKNGFVSNAIGREYSFMKLWCDKHQITRHQIGSCLKAVSE